MQIQLKGIRREFSAGAQTEEGGGGLHGIDLAIEHGDFVAIVGPSGAGKSTLLNLIGLLDRPTEGMYLIDGRAIDGLRESDRDRLRARTFGFVFQDSYVLPNASVAENVQLALRVAGVEPGRRDALVDQAMKRVGIDHLADRRAGSLSGGERQRAALARAIVTGPQIILADEPTGNLDERNVGIVLDDLVRLHAEGITVVVVTHDAQVAARAHRQVLVRDGRIVDDHRISAPVRGGESHLGVAEHAQTVSRWHAGLEDVRDGFVELVRNVRRSALLVVAIGLGVGGLVAGTGLSQTANTQVGSRISGLAGDQLRLHAPVGPETFVSDGDQPDVDQVTQWGSSLRSLPHVSRVTATAVVSSTAADIHRFDPNDTDPVTDLRVTFADEGAVADLSARSSVELGLLGHPRVHGVAVVGGAAAQALQLSPPGPGTSFWLNGQRVQVIGQLQGERAEGDASTIFVSRDLLAGFAESAIDLIYTVHVDAEHAADVAHAAPLALDPANPGQFTVERTADLTQLRQGISADLANLLVIMGGLLLVVATITASTAMFLAVRARTAEIALRRAIGTSRAGISRQFLSEGIFAGLAGGAGGACVGSVAVTIVAQAQSWVAVLAWWLPIVGVALGAATGLISAALPAIAASRRQPAVALRG